jgi:tetratricopeptide (TPR) repeat protein
MTTIQIITKNNEKTIKDTLESIKQINCEKIIIDLGSKDETLKICSQYDVLIANTSEHDLSKIRNEFSKEINFYINPWEVLIQGHEKINSIKETCKVYIFQNDIITKDIRIWTKDEIFINPIYETIINKNAIIDNEIIISSKGNPEDSEKIKVLEKWKSQKPFDSNIYYYLAFYYLSKRDYKKFFNYSQEYYLREKEIDTSYIMMRYYSSQINLHLGNIQRSIEDCLICLAIKPEMSEYWCLLGDIYYRQNQYKKSKEFYKNAILVGKNRKTNDDYPIEIKKYKEYPDRMVENIEKIIDNTSLY